MNAFKKVGLIFTVFSILVAACTPATQQDTQANGAGYCPPGTLKIISGQWYSCGGGQWNLVQDDQLQTFSSDQMEEKLSEGKVANFFVVGTVLALDPVPMDEIGYFIVGGVVMMVIFAADALPQANFIGNDAAAFRQWHQGSAITTDIVLETHVDPKLGALEQELSQDFWLSKLAPTGTTAIVIEDDYFSALLLGEALLAARITPVAFYTDCDSYSAGPVKTAHVVVVDLNSDYTATPGYYCVPEIYAQTPPPVVVLAYTLRVTDSTRSSFSKRGVERVFDKLITSQIQLVEIIVSLLP